MIALEGVSHSSFMSAPFPSFVLKNDLTPTVNVADAYKSVTSAIATFFGSIASGSQSDAFDTLLEASGKIMAPLVQGMELEGSYWLKPACYDSAQIDDNVPYCLHGSPWNKQNA